MAEVLGVVASGVAVATIVGQVTSCVAKLKSYWDQVKDVPIEICILLREVNTFNVILSQIQYDQLKLSGHAVTMNNQSLQQSLQLCQEGAKELTDLTSDLANLIEGKDGWRKKLGSVKVVLKKDDLKRLKRRMKCAINLLSLSYQCHTSTMIQLQPEIIVTRVAAHFDASRTRILSYQHSVSEHNEDIETSITTDIVARHYNSWTSSVSWLQYLAGSFEYHRQAKKYKDRVREEFEINYKIPFWISRTKLQCQGYSTLSGWQITCQAYRVLPLESPYWVAIMENNITSVRDMLLTRVAFVTDRNCNGQTALHFAVAKGHLEMCKMLLAEGADPKIHDNFDRTPLTSLLMWSGSLYFYRRCPALDICRLLLAADASEVLDDSWNFKDYHGTVGMFRYLQGFLPQPYYEQSFDAKMKVAANITESSHHNAPFLFDIALCNDAIITSEMIGWTNEYGETLLHSLAYAMGRSWARSRKYKHNTVSALKIFDDDIDKDSLRTMKRTDSWTELWRKRVCSFIAMGADVTALDDNDESPFAHVIYGYSWDIPNKQEKSLEKLLVIWLETLFEAGVDLETYGARELAGSTWPFDTSYPYGCESEVLIRLYGFIYGPTPSDWTFWITAQIHPYAADFWNMIEGPDILEKSPHTPIPGEWLDEFGE